MTLGVILYIIYYTIIYYTIIYYILYYYTYTIIYYTLYYTLLFLSSPPSKSILLLSSPFFLLFYPFFLFFSYSLFQSFPVFYSSSLSPLLFQFQSSHSKYTCRHLDILIYIFFRSIFSSFLLSSSFFPSLPRQFDPAQTNGVDG